MQIALSGRCPCYSANLRLSRRVQTIVLTWHKRARRTCAAITRDLKRRESAGSQFSGRINALRDVPHAARVDLSNSAACRKSSRFHSRT
jgi:hypothetical protein